VIATLLQGLSTAALVALVILGVSPAAAQQGDPEGVVTLVIENDTFAGGNSDRHYTNGIRLGWLTPSRAIPKASSPSSSRTIRSPAATPTGTTPTASGSAG